MSMGMRPMGRHCDGCDQRAERLEFAAVDGHPAHLCPDCLRGHIANAVRFIGAKGGESSGPRWAALWPGDGGTDASRVTDPTGDEWGESPITMEEPTPCPHCGEVVELQGMRVCRVCGEAVCPECQGHRGWLEPGELLSFCMRCRQEVDHATGTR